jgi:hypothetical protein
MSRPLDAETWARTSARLLKKTPAEARDILAELGLDADAWKAWEAHYQRQIDAEFQTGKLVLAKLYARECAAEHQRRAAGPAPAPASAAAAPASSAPRSAPSPPTSRSDAEPGVRGVPAAPSPLEPVTLLGETSPLAKPGSGHAELPFRKQVAVPPPAMVSFEPNPELGGTEAGSSTIGPALPFAGSLSLPFTSVEVYAYLTAAREHSPAEGQRALAAYGVDAKKESEVDGWWRQRMLSDLALRDRFAKHLAEARQRYPR